MDFTGISLDGEDGTQSIIRGIGFYNDRFIGDPVGQDRCGGESGFQGLEGFLGSIGKVHGIPLWVNRVSGITMAE